MATYGGGMIIHSSGVFDEGIGFGGGFKNVLSVPSGMYANIRIIDLQYSSDGKVILAGLQIQTSPLRDWFIPGGHSLIIQKTDYWGSVSVKGLYIIFKNSGA
jgi:hypothetical protein